MEHTIKVIIEEILTREISVSVSADSIDDAKELALAQVNKDYDNEKIILDADDFSDYSIKIL